MQTTSPSVPILTSKLTAALRAPALMSAVLFAAGGVGHALGNILLARVLPPVEYGVVALFLALMQIGISAGPLGMETVINRHGLAPKSTLLFRVVATGSVVGLLLAAIATRFYGMNGLVASILCTTVLVAVINRVAGAFFQSRKRFGLSLFLMLVHNWILLLAVPVVLLIDVRAAVPVALTVGAGYLMTAAFGWRRSVQEHAGESREEPPVALQIREGLTAVGVQLALGLFLQLDRLLIARTLSISDLAVYAVVFAIAGSPFRMLQVGVGYTLLPRLRNCATQEDARNLLRHEARLVLPLALLAAVGALLVTPWITRTFLAEHYEYSFGLLLAIVGVGLMRVINGFVTSTVSAIGSSRQFSGLQVMSWAAVTVAAICGFLGSRFGLTGVIVGIGVGSLTLAGGGIVIASRALRRWRRASPDPGQGS